MIRIIRRVSFQVAIGVKLRSIFSAPVRSSWRRVAASRHWRHNAAEAQQDGQDASADDWHDTSTLQELSWQSLAPWKKRLLYFVKHPWTWLIHESHLFSVWACLFLYPFSTGPERLMSAAIWLCPFSCYRSSMDGRKKESPIRAKCIGWQ